MTFQHSDAGKGDQSRVTDFKSYRLARIWWRSACCGEKVKDVPPGTPENKGVAAKYRCTYCHLICSVKRD